MFNSKYSNVLTVLLIIVIMVIVGLIAFLGFDMYRKYYIDKEAEDFMSKYEEQLGNITIDEDKDDKKENVIEQNTVNTGNTTIIDPGNQTITNTNTNNNGNSSSTGSGTTYKGFNVLGTIEIPKTGIKYPVLDKVTIKSIEVSVAYYYGPGLNEVGNTVIVGHNYRNGAFFGKNKKLAKGDSIYITDNSGKKIKYTIYDIYTTTETDAAYITRETNGKREISLSTCTDDSKGRLIVCARES